MMASIEATSAGFAAGVIGAVCGEAVGDGCGVGFSFWAMDIPVKAKQTVTERRSLVSAEINFTRILLRLLRAAFDLSTTSKGSQRCFRSLSVGAFVQAMLRH